MAKSLDDIISVPQAAKMLGVKDRQVRYLITTGALAATMFGGTYAIRRADLAKVPKERKPGPKPKK